jgi:hypothetical protein
MVTESFGFEQPEHESEERPAGRLLSRVLLLLPTSLLLLSGIAMVCAIPFAWGKGTHVGLEPWMTGFSGVAFAAPVLWIGGMTVLRVLRRTGESFTVFSLQLLVGMLLVLLLSLVEFALAFRITDARTFDTLRDDKGNLMAPISFLMVTLIGTFLSSSWLGVAAFLYTNGITPDSDRFARRLDEPDLMDELLRGQRPEGWRNF